MAVCLPSVQRRPETIAEKPSDVFPLTIEKTIQYDPVVKSGEKEISPEQDRLFNVRGFTYKTDSVIGKGKYGLVYACHEIAYSNSVINGITSEYRPRPRHVAIKRSENVDCHKTELQILLRCRFHSLILKMYDAVSLSDHQLMVMELLPGGDLFRLAFRQLGRRMTPAEVWFYLAECTEAVGYLHERGVVHQDVKSDNILLDSKGHIRLADYGLALHKLPLGQRCSGQLISSSRHMPPEIVLSNPRSKVPGDNLSVSHTVDWFSLGVMIYRLLYQCYPYEGRSPAELKTAYQTTTPSFNHVNGKAPPKALQDLLLGLLEPKAKNRLGGRTKRGFEEVFSHPCIRLHPTLRDCPTIFAVRERISGLLLRPPFAPFVKDDDLDICREL